MREGHQNEELVAEQKRNWLEKVSAIEYHDWQNSTDSVFASEWLQLAVGYTLIEGALWCEGYLRIGFVGAAAAWIIFASIVSKLSALEMGLLSCPSRCWTWSMKVAALPALLIALLGLCLGTFHFPTGRWPPFAGILLYSFS